MVLDWMITVVSPRWMLLEVVVIVRVTLQEVSTVAAPMIIRATIAPIIFLISTFMRHLLSRSAGHMRRRRLSTGKR